jgi:glycine cleavage system H lipoate-binding protein
VSCEVLEANGSLNDTPDLVNREPYGGAWTIKVKVRNPGEAGRAARRRRLRGDPLSRREPLP